MNGTTARRLLLALAGVFALDLRAEPAWTTGSCAPSDWTALSGNLVAGLAGTISGAIATGYSTNDPDLLTDGEVPTQAGKDWIVGFQNNSSVSWTFPAPRTLERVRVSCGYLAGSLYSGFTVSSVEVQAFGTTEWTAVSAAPGQTPNNGKADILSLVLADGNGAPLAGTIGALRVTFGAPPVGFANYCVEIEAAGFAEATGPVLGSLDVAPAKTKATVSGVIADVGTDATACDVYLALDSGAATKIATGVTGAFSYALKGLTAGTEYAYVLSVSNNAPTAKGTVRNGTFTMLAADARTASWTQKDVAPGDWTALSGNILSGNHGSLKSGAIAGTNYATDDSGVLTDGTAPTTGGAAYIYGFQNNAVMEWTLDNAMTLERLRISACYLAGNAYTRLAVGSVSVKLAGSDAWTALDAPAFSDIAGKSSNVVLCATLSDCETGVLSENVVGLRIAFGNVGALASYCAEIEAAGRAALPKGTAVISVR